MSRAALVLAIVAGCGGARPAGGGGGEPPSVDAGVDAAIPLEEDVPRLAARAADLLVALAEAIVAGGECPAVAARARAVLEAHAEVRAAAAAADAAGRGPAVDAALEAHAARIATASAGMPAVLERCAGDPALAEALTPLP